MVRNRDFENLEQKLIDRKKWSSLDLRPLDWKWTLLRFFEGKEKSLLEKKTGFLVGFFVRALFLPIKAVAAFCSLCWQIQLEIWGNIFTYSFFILKIVGKWVAIAYTLVWSVHFLWWFWWVAASPAILWGFGGKITPETKASYFTISPQQHYLVRPWHVTHILSFFPENPHWMEWVEKQCKEDPDFKKKYEKSLTPQRKYAIKMAKKKRKENERKQNEKN